MKNDIDKLFDTLEGTFDTQEPSLGHELRFEQKLKALNNGKNGAKTGNGSMYRFFLAAAAALVVALGIFVNQPDGSQGMELASVSKEFSQTQDFFTVAIREELKKIEAERSPFTEDLIYDGLRQLERLELEYDKLKIDLAQSQKDNRVIYAMISNFQTRIDILTNLLEQIENVKQLKAKQNETTRTL